jgi:hypothetical protein
MHLHNGPKIWRASYPSPRSSRSENLEVCTVRTEKESNSKNLKFLSLNSSENFWLHQVDASRVGNLLIVRVAEISKLRICADEKISVSVSS